MLTLVVAAVSLVAGGYLGYRYGRYVQAKVAAVVSAAKA